MLLVGLQAPHNPKGHVCDQARDDELRRLSGSTYPIVIGQAWTGYNPLVLDNGPPSTSQDEGNSRIAVALERTIDEFGGERRRFLIVGAQVAAPCNIISKLLEHSDLVRGSNVPCHPPIEEVRLKTSAINAMLEAVARKYPGNVQLLLPEKYLCDERSALTEGELSLYLNDDHFTVAGSEFVGRRAKPLLQNLLMQKPGEVGKPSLAR
jgi:hypothetical protein